MTWNTNLKYIDRMLEKVQILSTVLIRKYYILQQLLSKLYIIEPSAALFAN